MKSCRTIRLALAACVVSLPWRTASAADHNSSPTNPMPRNVTELWSGFDPRKEPLETEILKSWEQDGVACRIIRYQVGMFKGASAKVAAFHAFPVGKTKLPALLDLHGGGQSASLDNVITFARQGYACVSINWGGNPLNFGRTPMSYTGPQTDWGRLDATHPPQRSRFNHFATLTPDEFTLDPWESPRNSNWFLVLMAARRAITYLEQQPGVDPGRIGVFGHSMGGKLTTNLAGIDPRVKAAVPSCGGSGDILESQSDLPGCRRTSPAPLELACISDNAYIPRITCPMLWLSPTNDFHAHIDNMAWNWRNLPDDRTRFSISPHLNHRHTPQHEITRLLWFEEHLKGTFKMPRTPQLELELKTADGVPRITAKPDTSLPVQRVDIYYSIDPHGLTRFWRDAKAVKTGDEWRGTCPVMNNGQPLFAFANITYALPNIYQNDGTGADFAISSRVMSAAPAILRSSGVRSTDVPERMIDDGSREWHDWYLLNWGHPPLWTATTRKLKDPKWQGPDGATLRFEIQCHTDNTLVLQFNCNAWGAFIPGKPAVDYTVVKELKGSRDWQEISVQLSELAATDPAISGAPGNWRTVTEFSISPSGGTVRNGIRVKVTGKAWQGPRNIRNLRWDADG